MRRARITYDRNGTPAAWAGDPAGAYHGMGFLHGLHRPLQTLVVATAARAELARRLAPRADLVALDALAQRLDIPARAAAGCDRLSERGRAWVDAYVAGVADGLRRGGPPFELRALAARLAPPSCETVLGGVLLAAYLGLAESQERMERALVDALAAGADVGLLEAMFRPHLDGWQPHRLAALGRSRALGHASWGLARAGGGSNAWAVTGARSESGRPLLCGDPHLQVNQLPSVLFELRIALGDDWWAGASIAGLPGLAVGRSRRLAWAGTFAVADNVDFTIEELSRAGAARPGGGHASVVEREVEIGRRFLPALRLRFRATDRGVLEELGGGAALASRWAGAHDVAAAVEAYLALPLAPTAEAAERVLEPAGAFSLHYVLADAAGDVRYCQAGRIPRRSHGWSGLYPVGAGDERRWVGFYEGASLPRAAAEGGVVASANEARPAADGGVLSTLAQPRYRLDRIAQWLAGRARHDVAGMQDLQLDLYSRQAERLRPSFLDALDDGRLRRALAAWDLRCDASSLGAHAFDLAYQAAREALASELGGGWLVEMLRHSELGVWWAEGFDRVLADPASWRGPRGERLRAALGRVARAEPRPWGEVHRFTLSHLVLGGIPGLGLDRGPYALPGSLATVRQGTVASPGGHEVVTAPAYRFVCDLGDDGAYTSLPGGIDGSRLSRTYDRWLDDYLAGRYHRLGRPDPAEAPLDA